MLRHVRSLILGFASLVAALSASAAYQEVEWLESQLDGNSKGQFVILDYKPSGTDRVEAKFEITDLSRVQTLWCSRDSNSKYTFTAFYLNGGKFRFDRNQTATSMWTGVLKDTPYSLVVDYGTCKYSVNAGDAYSLLDAKEYTPAGRLTLFTCYACADKDLKESSGQNNYFVGKFYSLRIKDSAGEVKLDLVPARDTTKDSSAADACGVYDKVSGRFYPNLKTTPFKSCGPDVASRGDPQLLDVSLAESEGVYTVNGTLTGADAYVGYELRTSAGLRQLVLADEMTAVDTAFAQVIDNGLLVSGVYYVYCVASNDVNVVDRAIGKIAVGMPEGYLTWVANGDDPQLASVGANWSSGRAPTATDRILFDGDYSKTPCTWNAEAAQTVAGLVATNGYTSAIVVQTTYGEAFPSLTVTGDFWSDCAEFAPEAHGTTLSTPTYCLNLDVGGAMTLAGGRITASGRGIYSRFDQFATGREYSVNGGYGGYVDASGNWKYFEGLPGGSILAPTDTAVGGRRGWDGVHLHGFGGGAVRLSVGGAFVNDATIEVNGAGSTMGSGAGGSIYVRAKSVSGRGKYEANGSAGSKSDSGVEFTNTPAVGSGGRIALVATTGACAPEGTLSVGGTYGIYNQKTFHLAAASGTVYLEDKDGAVVRVGGANRTENLTRTPIPAIAADVPGLAAATLVLESQARVALTQGSLKMAALSVADEKSILDVAGKTLKVREATIGGVRLKGGTYTIAAGGVHETYRWLVNTSEVPGSLVVGSGFAIIIQ